MELPQGQTGSVGASVASTEQVEVEFFYSYTYLYLNLKFGKCMIYKIYKMYIFVYKEIYIHFL